MAEFKQSVEIDGDLVVSGTVSIGGTTPTLISEMLALNHDASAVASIVFTDNMGTVLILVEGQGDGATGSDAQATFLAAKKVGIAGTVNRAVSVVGSSGVAEEVEIAWPDGATLTLALSADVVANYGAGTTNFAVTFLSVSV